MTVSAIVFQKYFSGSLTEIVFPANPIKSVRGCASVDECSGEKAHNGKCYTLGTHPCRIELREVDTIYC